MGYDDAVRDRGSTEHSNEKDIVHCAKGVYFIMILCWLQSESVHTSGINHTVCSLGDIVLVFSC